MDSELRFISSLLYANSNDQQELYLKRIPETIFLQREKEFSWVKDFRELYGKYPSVVTFNDHFQVSLKKPKDPPKALLQVVLDRSFYEQLKRNVSTAKNMISSGSPMAHVIRKYREDAEAIKMFSSGTVETYRGDSQTVAAYYKERVRLLSSPNSIVIDSPWPTLNKLCGIFMPSETFLIGARQSLGKAQPLTAKVLMPDGYVEMRELEVGDLVIGSNGKPTAVKGVFPQGKLPVFRVKFTDGTSTECCADHLWFTQSHIERRRKILGSVKTTREIIESLYSKNGKKHLNHAVPLVGTVDFKKNDTPSLDPWLMGALLGDGCFVSSDIRFTNEELDIQQKFIQRLPFPNTVTRIDGINFSIVQKQRNTQGFGVRSCLIDLKLIGRKSKDKFIPDVYKYGSIRTRLELLRGLFDTDGSVAGDGTLIDYATISSKLAKDVAFISRSLGGIVRETVRWSYCCNAGYESKVLTYRLYIRFPKLKEVPVSSIKNIAKWRKKSFRHNLKKIESVQEVGSKDCQCISVEAPDSLYTTDDFILTHNTWEALWWASYLAQRSIRILVFSFEMGVLMLELRDESIWCQIPFDDLKNGCLRPKDLSRWRGLRKQGRPYVLYFSDPETGGGDHFSNMEEVIDRVRPQVVMLDSYYLAIHPSFRSNMPENQRQGVLSGLLKPLAKRTNTFVIGIVQVGRDAEDKKGATKPSLRSFYMTDRWGQDADYVMDISGSRGSDKRLNTLLKGRNAAVGDFRTTFSLRPPSFDEKVYLTGGGDSAVAEFTALP